MKRHLLKLIIFPVLVLGLALFSIPTLTFANSINIITGAGPGGGPQVRGFEASGVWTGLQFFAYDDDFRGGVDIDLITKEEAPPAPSQKILPPEYGCYVLHPTGYKI